MQSYSGEPRSRLRYVLAAALILAASLLLWWMLRNPAPPETVDKPRPRDDSAARTETLSERHNTPAEPPTAFTPPPSNAPPPIIDEVILEKSEVCEGEENLVTVRAHTPDGTDEYLHYTIVGETGPQVPLRRYKDEAGHTVPRTITVFGKDNIPTTIDLPAYVVKDCRVERAAYIDYRVMTNTPGDFELFARVAELDGKRDPNAPPFRPIRFDWDFGDGQSESSAGPLIGHSYEGRSQDTLESHFLVKVEVHGEGGETLVGRRSLALTNPAFENLKYQGIVVLFTSMTPRFPQMDERGVVTQQARLWHHRPDSVLITQIKMMRYEMGTGEYGPMETPSVEAILGSPRIPPGPGLTTTLSFDTRKNKNIAYITYWLEGTSSEGLPVRGNVTLMRPPDRPTRDNSNPVLDPVMLAKIKAARRILGKDYVTDEDLWRLEREGQFGNLEVDWGAGAAAPPPPTNLPKPYIPPPPDAGLPEGESGGTPPPPNGVRRPEGAR